MIERLKAMKKRLEEIDKLLIDGQLEIAAMTKLSKERKDLNLRFFYLINLLRLKMIKKMLKIF